MVFSYCYSSQKPLSCTLDIEEPVKLAWRHGTLVIYQSSLSLHLYVSISEEFTQFLMFQIPYLVTVISAFQCLGVQYLHGCYTAWTFHTASLYPFGSYLPTSNSCTEVAIASYHVTEVLCGGEAASDRHGDSPVKPHSGIQYCQLLQY